MVWLLRLPAIALALWLWIGFGQPAHAQAPVQSRPTTVFGDGVAVTPTAAWTYYQTQDLTSSTRDADPDIVQLARALGTAAKPNGDVDRIYAFVHDDIEMVWTFGLKAGARGALIDKAGTTFDQAHLMVELLRAAGYSASYQLGTITLTGTQFANWTGISNRNAAIDMLRKGGFPATVSGSGTTITSVTMTHVWVRVTIGTTPYVFDPSFKTITYTNVTGATIDAASGFNSTSFFNRAISGASTSTSNSTPRVRGMNRTNILADLQSAAQTLLTSISTNQANGDIEDVIGGSDIVPVGPAPVRDSSLAYQGTLYTTFANDVPPAFRTKTTLQFYYNGGTNQMTFNWFADEIYGEPISFSPVHLKGQTDPEQFRVYRGDEPLTGWLTGVIPSPNVTVNHPYAANQAGGAANGSYMDRTVTIYAGNVWGSLQLMLGFGRPSADLGAWQEQRYSSDEGEFVRTYGLGEAEPVTEHDQKATRRRMVAAYLAQVSQAGTMVGELGDAVVQQHDMIGFVTSSFVPGFTNTVGAAATTFHIGAEGAVSATALDANAGGTQAALRTYALLVPSLEGSLAEQMADSRYPASTPVKIDWAAYSVSGSTGGDNNDWFYWADSSNWTSYVKGKILTDLEGTSPVRDLAEDYILNGGYTLIIPRSSDLGPGPEEQTYCTAGPQPPQPDCTIPGAERGGTFVAIGGSSSGMAHLIGRPNSLASKGGGGSSDAEINPGRVFAVPEDFQDRQYTTRAESFNVDVRTGSLTYQPPADLTVGDGGYPYSLSFQRTYRARPKPYVPTPTAGAPYVPEDALFGESGWTSNLNHNARPGSDAMLAFGTEDPRAAASTIVAIRAMLKTSLDTDLSMGTLSGKLTALQRQLTANMAAAWWTRSVLQNTMTIEQGPGSRTFVRLANGTWAPPRGRDEALEVAGGREFIETGTAPKPGYWTYKYICVKHTGADRSVSYYGPSSWTSFNLASCPTLAGDATPESRNAAAKFQGQLFRRQVFTYGVQVDRTADGGLSNNLGRSLVVTGGATEGGVSNFTVKDGEDLTRIASFAFGGTTPAMPITGAELNLQYTDLEGHVWRYGNDGFTVSAPTAPGRYILAFQFRSDAHIVSKFSDANANETEYFVGSGRAGAVRDPLDRTSYVRFDAFGQPSWAMNRLGAVTTTAYDAHRRVVRVTEPEGNSTEYSYDGRHNRTEVRLKPKPGPGAPADIVKSATFHPNFNVPVTETDPLGNVTTNAYNATTGTLTSVTRPTVAEGTPVTTLTWNSLGQRVTKTDPTGVVTRYTYNSENYISSVIAADGTLNLTTALGYNSSGDIVSVTDPRGKIHTGVFDKMRRLVRWTAPASTGAETRWTYNADGLISQIRRATGLSAPNDWATTTIAYEPTARVRSVIDADLHVTRFQYDALNQLTMSIDPEGRTARNVYDPEGRVLELRLGDGSTSPVVHYARAYTPNGMIASVTDANGAESIYTYDPFDRLTRVTYPDPATGDPLASDYSEVTYDARSSVLTSRARNGSTFVHDYDALNRLWHRTVPASGSIPARTATFTYDLAGRTELLTETGGHSLDWGFDSAKRVTSVAVSGPQWAGSKTISYQYDAASNRTRLTWPDNWYVNYAYDDLNRLTTATASVGGQLSSYSYDPLSRRTSTSLDVSGAGGTITSQFTVFGDHTSLAHGWSGSGGVSVTYAYDRDHQLASETFSNAAYRWDPPALGTDSYGPDYLNRYESAPGDADLEYDASSNLTEYAGWAFAYDPESRLVSASGPSSQSATYTYDPLGRRVKKLATGPVSVTESYLNDGNDEIAEYDGSGTLIRRFVPSDSTDAPIAEIAANGTRRYFRVSPMGSVMAMTGNTGTLLEGPYEYDPYGAPSSADTSGGTPYRFQGRRYDRETGLYYFRARYYSPRLGRFLQVDPAGYDGGINLYEFAGGNPANLSDPFGLYKCDERRTRLPCTALRAAQDKAINRTKEARQKLADLRRELGEQAAGQRATLSRSAAATREIFDKNFGNQTDIQTAIDIVDAKLASSLERLESDDPMEVGDPNRRGVGPNSVAYIDPDDLGKVFILADRFMNLGSLQRQWVFLHEPHHDGPLRDLDDAIDGSGKVYAFGGIHPYTYARSHPQDAVNKPDSLTCFVMRKC